MRLLRPLLLTSLALLALTLGAVPPQAGEQPQPQYDVIDLGTLGGERSQANAINDRGEVVGWADTGTQDEEGKPIRHAFIWNQDLGMRDLDDRPTLESEGTDINERQEVVGWIASPNRGNSLDYRAFLWRSREGMALLRMGGYIWSAAYGINNRGAVVGVRDYGDNYTARWNRGRLPRWQGGGHGIMFAVNEQGSAVGTRESVHGVSAAQWAISGRERVLSRMTSGAHAIDNAGSAVGWIEIPERLREYEPFLRRRGRLVRLGNLPSCSQGAANGVRGTTAVGSCWSGGSPWRFPPWFYSTDELRRTDERAFIWRQERLTDLNTLLPPEAGWEVQQATGINERGQIVGYGLHNGVRRAFLLNPR